MKMKRGVAQSILLLILITVVAGTAVAQTPDSDFEAYFNFINTYPTEERTEFTGETQGITHDRDHWFISHENRLLKIPVGLPLGDDRVECNKHGVVCSRRLSSIAQLQNNYNHGGGSKLGLHF